VPRTALSDLDGAGAHPRDRDLAKSKYTCIPLLTNKAPARNLRYSRYLTAMQSRRQTNKSDCGHETHGPLAGLALAAKTPFCMFNMSKSRRASVKQRFMEELARLLLPWGRTARGDGLPGRATISSEWWTRPFLRSRPG
jgi:hypothetical protein